MATSLDGTTTIPENRGFIREEKRLTQEELAHRAGMHRTYLSDIERGGRNPSPVNIEKLAVGLGITLEELFSRLET